MWKPSLPTKLFDHPLLLQSMNLLHLLLMLFSVEEILPSPSDRDPRTFHQPFVLLLHRWILVAHMDDVSSRVYGVCQRRFKILVLFGLLPNDHRKLEKIRDALLDSQSKLLQFRRSRLRLIRGVSRLVFRRWGIPHLIVSFHGSN